MKYWTVGSLVLLIALAVAVNVFFDPVQFDRPDLNVDPAFISNPLYYPIPVAVLLVLSVGACLVPGNFDERTFSKTSSGFAGLLGTVSWFVASVAAGLFIVFVFGRWFDGYFGLLWVSSGAVQAVFLLGGSSFLLIQGRTGYVFSDVANLGRLIREAVQRYLQIFPVLLVATLGNVYLVKWMGIEGSVPYSLYFFASADTPLRMVLLFLLIVVLAPICEEIFFRGVLYSVCREWLAPLWAAGVSGFCFSLVHREPMWILPVFVLGFFLATEFERTDGLGVPMFIHAIQNCLSFLLIYVVMG